MTSPRDPRNHVFIVDGTLSRLDAGNRTHAGRLFHLLQEEGPSARQSTAYHAGVQGEGWRRWANAALGVGVNDAICAGYGALASRYRPGDRIFLFGFSRGAYAVRSLAGLIARVGLLRAEEATERRVDRAFRYYQAETVSPQARAFRANFCHDSVRIACIGVWDTVKALGLPYPGLSRFFPMATEFHDHRLASCVDAAYHALALDENRTAFAPILWEAAPGWSGRLEQVWFPGAHSDVGGARRFREDALPLMNINLVWMLNRAEAHGLILPDAWRERFPCDAAAPLLGNRAGIDKWFLLRRRRQVAVGMDGQALHDSVALRQARVRGYAPRGRLSPSRPVQVTEMDEGFGVLENVE